MISLSITACVIQLPSLETTALNSMLQLPVQRSEGNVSKKHCCALSAAVMHVTVNEQCYYTHMLHMVVTT